MRVVVMPVVVMPVVGDASCPLRVVVMRVVVMRVVGIRIIGKLSKLHLFCSCKLDSRPEVQIHGWHKIYKSCMYTMVM